MARPSSHYGALRLATHTDLPAEQVLSVCIQPDDSYEMQIEASPRMTAPPSLGVVHGFGKPERILPSPVYPIAAQRPMPRYAGLSLN